MSPSGFRFYQQASRAFAGLMVYLSSLKLLFLTDLKRWMEAPMKHAFVLGIRAVLFEIVWTIGTGYVSGVLPG